MVEHLKTNYPETYKEYELWKEISPGIGALSHLQRLKEFLSDRGFEFKQLMETIPISYCAYYAPMDAQIWNIDDNSKFFKYEDIMIENCFCFLEN